MKRDEEYFKRKCKNETERFIREHCLYRVVKNDGAEINRLFEQNCSVSEARHKGNFVFEVSTLRFGSIALIWTEPMDEEGEYIRITGYSICP